MKLLFSQYRALEFKAKVALEVMSGLQTLEEIASKHGVYPVMISKWKTQLQKNVSGVFGNSKEKKEYVV